VLRPFRLLILVATLIGTPLSWAVPQSHLLPDGPAYVRSRDLSQLDVASAPVELILDLRGLGETTAEGSARLNALLAAGSVRTVRLVLVDPETAPSLRAAVRAALGRVLILGANLPPEAVDVAVATPVESDRRAVAALDDGKAPQELLATAPEKARYDESAMVRDHAKGLPIPEAPQEQETDDGKTAPPAPEDAVLVDRVLERALHLHRALRAIRRI
jgi:hypothetical protein